MSDPSFNSVTVRQPTAGASADLLTLDSVDGGAGNGAALRFINNSTGALSLALGRIGVARVDATTVRLDLAIAADPSLSSGDTTSVLLSLIKGAGPPSITTAAGSTLAVGGALSVSGAASLSSGLSVSGDMSLTGTLSGRTIAADGAQLDAHLASTANPHATTAAQVGALSLAGGAVTGSLSVQGKLGVGLTDPGFALDVADRMRVRQGGAGTAGIWLYQSGPSDDRAFVGMASDSSVGFWGNTGAGWGLTMDTSSGNVALGGTLSLPNTGGGQVSFSNAMFSNESTLRPNNLKLIMGHRGFQLPGSPSLQYEFAIGHSSMGFGGPSHFVRTFRKVFSINQSGDAFFAGAKTGYVVDHFVNRVGEPLEQGDVVVISQHQTTLFTGVDNNIPLPEVDLSDQPYDRRVCGIVAHAVAEQDLPPVDEPLGAAPDSPPTESSDAPYEHPLRQYAAGADYERTRVPDQQLGTMVTLGAFAHCKVDADIAPISPGDLLTTSPTRGHAQKVLEPERCAGAVIGKALAALAKGKGKIPVMVMLQ